VRGVWLVALREMRERGRSRTFVVTSVVTLLLVVGLILVPPMLTGGTNEYRLGLVGDGNGAIVDATERLATAADDPDEPASVVLITTEFPSRGGAEASLAAGEVDAVLVDGSEVIVENVGWGGSPLLRIIQQGAAAVELERLVAEAGETAAQVIEVMTSDPLSISTLSGRAPGDESRYIVAYAGLLLLYIAVLLYGTWILTGVTEEKSNRVVEVLLSSVKPWQLLGGKILGIGALGISQFVVTVLTALVALRASGVDFPDLDPVILSNLVLWFVLGFLVFAVLFGAAGSLASRMEDAQNVAFPMSMVAVIGFFVSISALGSPSGMAATVGTFVPITAPFVVPVRVALDAIPAWQFIVALLATVTSIALLIRVAGRIYAGGLLRYGGRVKLAEAWRGAVE
jgi:ABC-2 type transport system permease protein